MELKLTCKFSVAALFRRGRPQYLTGVKNTDGMKKHDESNQQEMEFPT